MSEVQSITISSDVFIEKINKLESDNKQLIVMLNYEKQLRKEVEEELNKLKNDYSLLKKSKNKKISNTEKDSKRDFIISLRKQGKTVDEIAFELGWSYATTSKEVAYIENTDIKINGVKKATAANYIKSYDDFFAIQNYFLKKNQIRNYAMWTVGVAIGLRASDIISLKYSFFLTPDKKFRERIKIVERKTRKYQHCLITEAVSAALSKYFDSIKWEFDLDDKIFDFEEGNCYKIIQEARNGAGLSYGLSTHSMRRSFGNIGLCVCKEDTNSKKITTIQRAYNHNDLNTTLKYLGILVNEDDELRISVSDFLLGKTEENVLSTKQESEIVKMLKEIDNNGNKIIELMEEKKDV